MSYWDIAMEAAKKAVSVPTVATTPIVTGARANRKLRRAIM